MRQFFGQANTHNNNNINNDYSSSIQSHRQKTALEWINHVNCCSRTQIVKNFVFCQWDGTSTRTSLPSLPTDVVFVPSYFARRTHHSCCTQCFGNVPIANKNRHSPTHAYSAKPNEQSDWTQFVWWFFRPFRYCRCNGFYYIQKKNT